MSDIPPGQPKIHGLIQNLATSLTDSISGATQSWKTKPWNVLGVGRKPTDEERRLSEQAKQERETQNRRIQIRLLLRQKRYSEVATIAANLADEELAAIAVVGLADFEAEEYKANPQPYAIQADCLYRLAHGYSVSASKALQAFFYRVDDGEARKIFLSRMEQEHWQYMALNGLSSAEDLLVLSCEMDAHFGTSLSESHFASIWKALASDEVKQYKLLGNILGDPEPLDLRYAHTPSLVSANIKMRAVALADNFPPDQRERLLVYAAEDSCDDVSLFATQKLMHYWSSPEGKNPPWLEPFPMLNLNLNFYLANMAAAFQWMDGEDDEEEVQTCLADLERLRLGIKYAGEHMEHSLLATLKDQLAQVERQCQVLSQKRCGSLQKLVNRICAALDIPAAIVDFTENNHMTACYLVGTGRIAVARDLLLTNEPLSEALMSTLLHEVLHMEQDVQTIRLICDSLDITYGQHSRELKQLMELYSESVGYAPEPIFLLAVLRMRDDRPLSPAQRSRAERLYKGSLDSSHLHERATRLEARLEKIEKAKATLESGEKDCDLLLCLKDNRGLAQLFQKGRVPLILLDELSDCKAEVERTLHELAAALPAEQREAFQSFKKDKIDLAIALFSQGVVKPFAGTMKRIKHVLLQVIKEECRKLNRSLVITRRQGYHEDEAYYITDRTHIIVKALRKGWYKMN
ncbi:MAG TPA: hypothetical protein PLC15_00010 [Candidatus Obscuribacter sp.]|nr:hypothetical protein [Candidatus Obscuribacter sp.]HMY51722.1 hypothetical protein [Candidatus Obscuribacter sp.]HNB13725.1 hypothetical protein [Candidatus Obscuribacter sp.]HND05654.1 hypothetical protein [Candidatus Obscuribacter sp.]HND67674.1 hypothetical protein [Candidatus Obscuribacter sp.]